MTTPNIGTVRCADQPHDYERFGIKPNAIENHEDGMREDAAGAGAFEWWYFEVGLQDGTAIVVAFLTKPIDDETGELQPIVSIKIRLPGGSTTIGGDFAIAKESFLTSRDLCYVQAGDSSCRYQGNGRYRVDLRQGDIEGTIVIQGKAPPARIGTGHLLFEHGGSSQYLGWLVPVPLGIAQVNCKVGGKDVLGAGAAYHDHNWGDRPMAGPIHHWYWGRAVVDNFVVIAANMTMQPSYGSVDHVNLILIKDGQFIAQGDTNVTFAAGSVIQDPQTNVPVADVTSYTFVEGATQYAATFTRRATVLTKNMGGAAYHRFAGEFTLEVSGGPAPGTHRTDKTTWELMWFGSDPALGLKLYTSTLSDPTGA
jgi:hypothetical protein